MAEANELTVEQLQQKLTELESKVTTLATDKEYWEKEAKGAFEKRDGFKKQLESIEKEKLESTNQFQDLYKKEQERATTLEKQLEEVKPFKERWTNFETTRKESLLKDIEDPDLKEVGKKYELEDLEILVAKIKKPILPTDGGRSGGGSFNYEGKKWDDLQSKDKEELSKSNPDLYRKLYYEKYRRNPEI